MHVEQKNTGFLVPKVETRDYSAMTDRRHVLDQPVKIDIMAYGNIKNIATSQGDNCTNGHLLDHLYFIISRLQKI